MKVLLFGIAKDIVGKSEFNLPIEPKQAFTVLELKAVLVSSFPDFGRLSSFAVAVNSEYANDTFSLKSSDEIAIIPPVSGG
tara:strand:- start:494 stop:736 length:243 start_codon:yes stop_codon:yes gene_type:complete